MQERFRKVILFIKHIKLQLVSVLILPMPRYLLNKTHIFCSDVQSQPVVLAAPVNILNPTYLLKQRGFCLKVQVGVSFVV